MHNLMIELWFFLNAADVATTGPVVEAGGLEMNPILASLSENSLALLGIKLVLAALTIALLYKLRRLWLLKSLNVGLFCIVAWNILCGWA